SRVATVNTVAEIHWVAGGDGEFGVGGHLDALVHVTMGTPCSGRRTSGTRSMHKRLALEAIPVPPVLAVGRVSFTGRRSRSQLGSGHRTDRPPADPTDPAPNRSSPQTLATVPPTPTPTRPCSLGRDYRGLRILGQRYVGVRRPDGGHRRHGRPDGRLLQVFR